MIIELNITEEQRTTIVQAFCANYGYKETVTQITTDDDGNEVAEEVPNPVSPVDFARAKIMDFVKQNVVKFKAKETDAARRQAMIDAQTDMETITLISVE